MGEIEEILEELKRTKYNKHTQYHIGRLKARLAKLREEKERGDRKRKVCSIKKSGDATILLVGFPSVGKSTLLNMITSAHSKIGDYPFTTLDIIPGVLEYNSAKIQILDIPGIVSEFSRKREILSYVRNADLVLIMIDKIEQLGIVKNELYEAGFRLDQSKPNVQINKTFKGGIKIESTVKLKHIDKKMIKLILNENGIHNAEVLIREDLTLERLIDSLSKNRVYIPSLTVFNKIDLLKPNEIDQIKKSIDCVMVSSLKGKNVDFLKEKIWEKLNLVRVYLKKIGKPPDLEKPLIIKRGEKIRNVCERIHKDFERDFAFAKLWGSSKFPGQRVGLNYELKDKDTIELHTK
jgi:hypothetical protein